MKENSPKTIGSIIDKTGLLKDKLSTLNKEIKDLREEKTALEQALLLMLHEQNITQSRGTSKSATINNQTFYEVENWDDFLNFVTMDNMQHLLQRKLSTPACQEIINTGLGIPGIKSFTKETISLRKI